MASIKNIEVKNVKYFKGLDFTGVEASLYMDKKKVGSILDRGDGGELSIYLDSEYQNLREEFDIRVNKYFEENPTTFSSPASFIEEIIELKNWESIFKKQKKKKQGVLVILHSSPRNQKENQYQFDQTDAYFVTKEHIPLLLKKHEHAYYEAFETIESFNKN